ncbi:MAG: carboxypeptidase regulatory-like domain-containing protein [Gemmatimonadales bacterium]
MTKPIPAVIAVLVGYAHVLAGQDLGSITGTVRDTAGVALAAAEVILGNKRLLTTPQGGFRFDSLPVGTHLITIRLVGYAALRSPVSVRTGIGEYNYVLHAAPQVLPTLNVDARRVGIYGTVGDTGFTPLAGVKVQLAGRGGGEAITDSDGRFAFPRTSEGQYVVRIVLPGYAEKRLFVELKKREGMELAIRLRPSRAIARRADEVAVHDLGRRLVANLADDRLNTRQLERYGSLGLCDVPGIVARLKAPPNGLTIILNGTVILENMPVHVLCSWQAAEVELVEFGYTVCRDATRTLVDMLSVWCTRFNEQRDRSPSALRALREGTNSGGRIPTQRKGGPFVVIWERM